MHSFLPIVYLEVCPVFPNQETQVILQENMRTVGVLTWDLPEPLLPPLLQASTPPCLGGGGDTLQAEAHRTCAGASCAGRRKAFQMVRGRKGFVLTGAIWSEVSEPVAPQVPGPLRPLQGVCSVCLPCQRIQPFGLKGTLCYLLTL